MEEQQEQLEAPPPDHMAAAAMPPESESTEPNSPESGDPIPVEMGDTALRAVIEAVVYITEEPLSAEQIATALKQKKERVEAVLASLVEASANEDRGLIVKEVAGGFKMGTKPEHHDVIRQFVKNLKQPLKLSLAALETLAVIAYKQPITAPEIMEIRGVQGTGVLKTLLDRKLIVTGGRKNVVGKPILYKTTREFLVQFGLSGLNELPTLKEFEELSRLALDEDLADANAEASAERMALPEVVEGKPATSAELHAEGASEEPEQQSQVQPAVEIAEQAKAATKGGSE